MPIVTLDDENEEFAYDQTAPAPKDIPDTPSEVINKVIPDKNEYETIEIVNRDKQLEKVIQYIDGKEWKVDYYLQLITKDSEIGRFDPNSPDVSKQYCRLNGMILYVQSALTQNTASELTGSAIINANVTPNEGDTFVATLMGKRRGLVTIEKVNKRDYNLKPVWEIEYKLDMFLDTNDAIIGILNDKVVKTYYYDEDFLMTNSEPILLEEDFKQKRKVTISIKDTIEYYFKTMFHSERSVLSIPGQGSVNESLPVVDIMLQEFIFKIVNSTESEYISKISRNTIPDDVLKQPTIWDALLNRNPDILGTCHRKIIYVSATSFINNIRLRNIAYMGIRYLAYPETPDIGISESPCRAAGSVVFELTPNPSPYRGNKGEVANLIPVLDTTDKTYVFTEAFYDDDRANMSIFETAVRDYLDGKTLDNSTLASIIDDYQYWDRVQQFYFIPILILILRDATRRTSSTT